MSDQLFDVAARQAMSEGEVVSDSMSALGEQEQSGQQNGSQHRHDRVSATRLAVSQRQRVMRPWLVLMREVLMVKSGTTFCLSKKTTRVFLSPSAPLCTRLM